MRHAFTIVELLLVSADFFRFGDNTSGIIKTKSFECSKRQQMFSSVQILLQTVILRCI